MYIYYIFLNITYVIKYNKYTMDDTTNTLLYTIFWCKYTNKISYCINNQANTISLLNQVISLSSNNLKINMTGFTLT